MSIDESPISAVLLIGSTCPHCSGLLQVLSKLVKSGEIGALEIINVASLPERAAEYGVRSVPWLRLGPFELDGAQTEGDIRHWLGAINSEQGMTEYLAGLLTDGKLGKVIHLVHANPLFLHHLLTLVVNPETDMKVQLGIAAVFEDLQGASILNAIVGSLGRLTEHASAKVRADAAHFLSLATSQAAIPYLKALENDENSDVREIVVDALDALVSGEIK